MSRVREPLREALEVDGFELVGAEVADQQGAMTGFESVFNCRSLEVLFVFAPPDHDLGRFGELTNLRRLELSEGRRLRTTAGVEKLRELRFLGLYLQQCLEDLAGVDQLGGLRELAIETCRKLTDLKALAGLRGLTKLKVANCREIASLRLLTGLESLEQFLAWDPQTSETVTSTC